MNQSQSESRNLPAQRAEAWNSISEGWHNWIPKMREWYAPATNLMLDLADANPGDHILDIAAGDCDQSIAAAERVGENGYVLAIDLAKDMLEIGARSAREAGLSNIDIRVMDGQNLDLPADSFDAAICRFGLMFFPNPVKALRGIKHVLTNSGRVSVVIYQDDGEPEFTTAVSIIRDYLNLPEPSISMDSLGKPGILHQTLVAGGFNEVNTQILTLPIHLDSVDDCVHYLQSTSPTIATLISDLDPDGQQEIWDKIHKSLRIYEMATGFMVEHHVIVGTGLAA